MWKSKVQETIRAYKGELESLGRRIDDLDYDFQKTLDGYERRTKDLTEGFGRRLRPDTESCEVCSGVGGKWIEVEAGPRTPLIFAAARVFMDKEWWTCDTCKGTGRIPIEKKKG